MTTGTAASRAFGMSLQIRVIALVVIIVALVSITAMNNPRFLSPQSLRDVLASLAIVLLITGGQSVVIITRGIDLSVGAVVGLSAYLTADALQLWGGLPAPVALMIGGAIGAAAGIVNGVLVRLGGVPPLVATLGTMYVYRGATYWISDGQRIPAARMPQDFLGFGSASVWGIPVITLIAAVAAAGVWVVMAKTRLGRDLYAIGSNPPAAELVGIPMANRLITAYAISGLLAGVGGALYAARFGTVDPNAGTGMELTVIAAAVVGGIAIFGGSGSVIGAAVGAVLLTLVASVLPVLKVDPFWQQAIVGALILFAIAVDRFLMVIRSRKEHGK